MEKYTSMIKTGLQTIVWFHLALLAAYADPVKTKEVS